MTGLYPCLDTATTGKAKCVVMLTLLNEVCRKYQFSRPAHLSDKLWLLNQNEQIYHIMKKKVPVIH